MLALAAMALAIPLHFEPNDSALNSRPCFSAVTNRYSLELSDTAISVHFHGSSSPMIGSGSPLPTELAGVSILVGGVAAPILAVAPLASGMQQINFQVPVQAPSSLL
jgi:hypothetical protein